MPASRRLLSAAVISLAALLLWCCPGAPIVLGTFNIRTFPGEKTDPEAVARAIAGLNADAFAVQEIADVAAFKRVLERASALTGRTYAVTLRPSYCRHDSVHLGVVHDTRRLERVEDQLLGEPTCPKGQPAGMLALLRDRDDRRFTLASVHFKSGGKDGPRQERLAQWAWLAAELPDLTDTFRAPVIVAGDFNSTGYLDTGDRERRFIDALVAREELQLPTGALDCSMYWQPQKQGPYAVSLLDHVLAPRALKLSAPEVLGMCAELACAPQDGAPADFDAVSDHCPVRVQLRL